MTTSYGFVGLGNLGVHLAGSSIRAGFETVVFDLNPKLASGLTAAGARWAESVEALTSSVDAVVTCLPSPTAVETVVAGERGVISGLKSGGTWIDMSTNDLHVLQRLAALAEDRGIGCLEAPVTGGVHKAAAGEITVIVGGDESLYHRHLPLFQAIGDRVFHVGPIGQASVIKVITNMLAFIHLVAAGEALMLAKRAGLDLTTAFEVIRASSGNSFVHETESQVILNGSYNIGFTMDLAAKDLAFATALGEEFGVPLRVESLVEEIFAEARARYGGSAWSPMVVKLLEDELGVDLRAAGFPETLT